MRRKTARKLAPHLPALHRHARVLSGSEEAGMIDRLLRRLRDKDYRALPPREVRPRLFRDFHDSWSATRDAANTDNATQIALRDRYGLLLRHVEGFSVQDVATILRCDVLELQTRLEKAFANLHGAASRDILLVEDDPVLAKGLTDMIESLGHRVLGVARDCAEALATAQSVPFDAIVADIHADTTERVEGQSPMDRLLGQIKTPIVLVAPDAAAERPQSPPPYIVETPFQVAELKIVLSQALHNRQQEVTETAGGSRRSMPGAR